MFASPEKSGEAENPKLTNRKKARIIRAIPPHKLSSRKREVIMEKSQKRKKNILMIGVILFAALLCSISLNIYFVVRYMR